MGHRGRSKSGAAATGAAGQAGYGTEFRAAGRTGRAGAGAGRGGGGGGGAGREEEHMEERRRRGEEHQGATRSAPTR